MRPKTTPSTIPNEVQTHRRIAEAIHGLEGSPLGEGYFVLSPKAATAEVAGPFASKAEADKAAKRLNGATASAGAYGTFGPFTIPPARRRFRVSRVIVEFDAPDGTHRRVIQAHEADALFWSASAIEKFADLYYTAVLGPAFAPSVVGSPTPDGGTPTIVPKAKGSGAVSALRYAAGAPEDDPIIHRPGSGQASLTL